MYRKFIQPSVTFSDNGEFRLGIIGIYKHMIAVHPATLRSIQNQRSDRFSPNPDLWAAVLVFTSPLHSISIKIIYKLSDLSSP